MNPTEQADRWLADCPRQASGNSDPAKVYLLEADVLAAIARNLAPGDEFVERATTAMERLEKADPFQFPYSAADAEIDAANTITALLARISALTATVAEMNAAVAATVADVREQRSDAEARMETAEAEAARLRDRLARMEGAFPVPPRLVPELITWAKDEQQHWPDDTAYQDDLAAFLAALTDGTPE